MKFKLKIWRQENNKASGKFEVYEVDGITGDTSFLEMLDAMNIHLIENGGDPVAFDSDCREGVCGTCSMVINGEAHGPQPATTTCQLYMRHFQDGAEIVIEPWRATAFPVIRDLVVDRTSFDRIMQAGGYITVHSGPKPEPNSIPIEPEISEEALDAASCIGCGACVAACPNASAMLYTSAKVAHLSKLPQGQPERKQRVKGMVEQMEAEGFGSCRNYGECEAQCPKEISIKFIGELNREYMKATLFDAENPRGKMTPQ